MKTSRAKILILTSITFLVTSCDSGSSGYNLPESDSTFRTVSFDGEVEQGSLAANLSGTPTKNTPLAGVEVCALGSCTTTTETGAYLFNAKSPAVNGAVEFTLSSPIFSAKIPVIINSKTTDVEAIFIYDPSTKNTRAVEVELDGVVDPGQSDGSFNDGD